MPTRTAAPHSFFQGAATAAESHEGGVGPRKGWRRFCRNLSRRQRVAVDAELIEKERGVALVGCERIPADVEGVLVWNCVPASSCGGVQDPVEQQGNVLSLADQPNVHPAVPLKIPIGL